MAAPPDVKQNNSSVPSRPDSQCLDQCAATGEVLAEKSDKLCSSVATSKAAVAVVQRTAFLIDAIMGVTKSASNNSDENRCNAKRKLGDDDDCHDEGREKCLRLNETENDIAQMFANQQQQQLFLHPLLRALQQHAAAAAAAVAATAAANTTSACEPLSFTPTATSISSPSQLSNLLPAARFIQSLAAGGAPISSAHNENIVQPTPLYANRSPLRFPFLSTSSSANNGVLSLPPSLSLSSSCSSSFVPPQSSQPPPPLSQPSLQFLLPPGLEQQLQRHRFLPPHSFHTPPPGLDFNNFHPHQHPIITSSNGFFPPMPFPLPHQRLFPNTFLPGGAMPSAHHAFLFSPFRKPKRIRTAFSPSQLLRLEHAFEKNHYVVGAERKQLAQCLGLSETQVKIWFQNRRTKFKRMKQEGGEGGNNENDVDDDGTEHYDEEVSGDEDDETVQSDEKRAQNTDRNNFEQITTPNCNFYHHRLVNSDDRSMLMGLVPAKLENGSNFNSNVLRSGLVPSSTNSATVINL